MGLFNIHNTVCPHPENPADTSISYVITGLVSVIPIPRNAEQVARLPVIVVADAITLRIRIGEDAALQHLVRREADAAEVR